MNSIFLRSTRMTCSAAMSAIFIFLASANSALGQTPMEGITYSTINRQGTARSMGFGNALGSIGGDFSSLSVNPAGIGVYRKGEIMITPAININTSNSRSIDGYGEDDQIRGSLNNIGLIATQNNIGKAKRSNWSTVSFGIGFNRVANFNSNYSYTRKTNESSQSEAFAFDANTYYNEFASTGNFDTRSPAFLGYNAFLIDTFGSNGEFITVVDYSKGITQRQSVRQTGGINEFTMALGGNYKEKLMLGFSIGVPILNFRKEQSYTEQDETQQQNFFGSYTYYEDLRVKGSGVNAKLGAIFVPTSNLRIGASFHTPSLLLLTEEFDSRIQANTENFGGNTEILAETSSFEYNVVTPWRAVLSAALLIGKRGFITLDYEYADPSATRFKLNTDNNEQAFGPGYFAAQEAALNSSIRNTYQATSSLRIGGEIKLEDLMLRAGLGVTESPYDNSPYSTQAPFNVSAGIGYRFDRLFIDLGYMRTSNVVLDQAYYIPYTVGAVGAPIAEVTNNSNIVALTLGLKF